MSISLSRANIPAMVDALRMGDLAALDVQPFNYALAGGIGPVWNVALAYQAPWSNPSLTLNSRGFNNSQERTQYALGDEYNVDRVNFVIGDDRPQSLSVANLSTFFWGGNGDDAVSLRLDRTATVYHATQGESALFGGNGIDTLKLDFRSMISDLTFSTDQLTFASGQVSGLLKAATDTAAAVMIDARWDSFERLEIYAGAGDDLIYGGLKDDHINAGSGHDTIIGGAGRDIMYGGSGKDTFVFAAYDSGTGSARRDYIADFQAGIDRIDLTALGPDTKVKFETMGDNTLVRVDGNGFGEDFQIQVKGAITLGDFLLL